MSTTLKGYPSINSGPDESKDVTITEDGTLSKVGMDVNVINPNVPGKSPLITNLSMAIANTEYSHNLQDGLKYLLIRNRDKKLTKVAFNSGESGTKYVTLEPGTTWDISPIDFTSKVLYVQSPSVSILEIFEIYTI